MPNGVVTNGHPVSFHTAQKVVDYLESQNIVSQ